MAEIIAGIFEGLFALLELVLETIVFLARRSVALIAWICSKSYRERKKAEWDGNKLGVLLELGFSGLCVAGLVAIGVWLAAPDQKSQSSSILMEIQTTNAAGETRLSLRVSDTNGETAIIAVKPGGVGKILTTKTLEDLQRQIEENVIVTRSPTNQIETNLFPTRPSESLSTTNSRPDPER